MTILDEGWRTPRKQHTCDQCGRPIPAGGDKYYYQAIAEDGRIDSVHLHADCEQLAADLFHAEIQEEDEWGRPCHPHLASIDLDDLDHLDDPELRARYDAWAAGLGQLSLRRLRRGR